MFRKKNTRYESDIVLGERYRDEQTGLEGVATMIAFFQHACERVSLEYVNEGELKECGFDAPRLIRVSTGKQAASEKPGGPARGEAGIRRGSLRRS